MRLLLDTHAFLWFVEGNPRISGTARAAIEDMSNERLVSVVALWEIAIKSSLGKLALEFPFAELAVAQITGNAMELFAIEQRHLVQLHALPFHHNDPFDRLLVAQALTDGLTLVSQDPKFEDYGVRLLW